MRISWLGMILLIVAAIVLQFAVHLLLDGTLPSGAVLLVSIGGCILLGWNWDNLTGMKVFIYDDA